MPKYDKKLWAKTIYSSCIYTGDDLITPVYVPPTRPPTTTPKGPVKTPSKPCDDEDCFAGSGSGEVTTDEITTSKGENQFFIMIIIKHDS